MAEMIVKNVSFKQGQKLNIVGVPSSSAKDFAVNICPNREDIALRINPRFTVPEYVNTVVYNSRQGGSWGQEIKGTEFSFTPGKNFQISIAFSSDGFTVQTLKGQPFQFANRLTLDNYSFITFDGDVTIQSIEITP